MSPRLTEQREMRASFQSRSISWQYIYLTQPFRCSKSILCLNKEYLHTWEKSLVRTHLASLPHVIFCSRFVRLTQSQRILVLPKWKEFLLQPTNLGNCETEQKKVNNFLYWKAINKYAGIHRDCIREEEDHFPQTFDFGRLFFAQNIYKKISCSARNSQILTESLFQSLTLQHKTRTSSLLTWLNSLSNVTLDQIQSQFQYPITKRLSSVYVIVVHIWFSKSKAH